jgi:hypothetical protein
MEIEKSLKKKTGIHLKTKQKPGSVTQAYSPSYSGG